MDIKMDTETDLAPEAMHATALYDDLPVAALLGTEDAAAEPEPQMSGLLALSPSGSVALATVVWPPDREAPDYAYLAGLGDPGEFTLDARAIEVLLQANRFQPDRSSGLVGFALRGASLIDRHEVLDRDRIALVTTRPDHRRLRCVIGFLDTATGRITAFSGSTVPNRRWVLKQKGNGGRVSNMLPTGIYSYYVWRHRTLPMALRLSHGNGSSTDLERGADASVIRNRNDGRITTADLFDLSAPLANIHCSYFLTEIAYEGAAFSSAGCLTVRGSPEPSDQWKRFTAILQALGERRRVDMMLVTGKDAAIAARSGAVPELAALRPGSRGAEVAALQQRLGLPPSGFFGPRTADRLTARQREINTSLGNGRIADGIYSRAFDARTGWAILDDLA